MVDKSDNVTSHRVCAVGSPGIGMSVATPVLIRMLLEANKTVFYHVQDGEEYYEFKYDNQGETITWKVFEDCGGYEGIESLHESSTYSGRTRSSCDPEGPFLLPKSL